MSRMEVAQFRCRSDNFGLLLHDPASGLTAAIDTPDGEVIWRELQSRNWQLSHIFNTHHHYDHVPGNEMLKERTGCTIVGAKIDAHRIPGIDLQLTDGEQYLFGNQAITMIETPGHTMGSVCYFVQEDRFLFTGDTLFSMGCGRLMEGSAQTMWHSLQKIMALPEDTKIYCGHEYTLTNAEFALEIEPGNKALQARANKVRELRRARQDTLPVSLSSEKATNPFLRPDSAEIQKYFNLQGASKTEIFAAIRTHKNQF
ncbi:MAG: hydroxyacylglutathione hydrolase [Hyphomicrobiaceae bacterium]|nr:hydroxyacylglutathione hydrolase [Hyphomicrobiaceae bacterium]